MKQGAYRIHGFSLIELMVAITLGLFLLLAITKLMLSQSNSRDELEKSSRLIENGRYAITLLQDELQLAGFYGLNGYTPKVMTALPSGCEVGLTAASLLLVRESLNFPLQGFNNPTAVPSQLAGCLDVGNYLPGTDVVIVRRAQADSAPITVDQAVLKPNELFIQSTPVDLVVGAGGSTATAVFTLVEKDETTKAKLRPFIQDVYFISPCNVPSSGEICSSSADGGRPIPTLKRMEISNGAFVIKPLAEGITDLQIEYGLDTNADGGPDTYKAAPSIAELKDVLSARISILARSIDASPGHTDTRSYVLGTKTIAAPGDHYKRQAYSAIAELTNLSGRRE